MTSFNQGGCHLHQSGDKNFGSISSSKERYRPAKRARPRLSALVSQSDTALIEIDKQAGCELTKKKKMANIRKHKRL